MIVGALSVWVCCSNASKPGSHVCVVQCLNAWCMWEGAGNDCAAGRRYAGRLCCGGVLCGVVFQCVKLWSCGACSACFLQVVVLVQRIYPPGTVSTQAVLTRPLW